MVERTIVLPIRDNDGVSLAAQLRSIRLEILALAGGYSETKQHGAWRNGATDYYDSSWRISTTVEPDIDARLIERIPAWAERLRQVCIYTHAVQVQADFVYPEHQENTTTEVA